MEEMIIINNRNLHTYEGITNTIAHVFGVKTMCRIKYLLGWIRGFKRKRNRLSVLRGWIERERARDYRVPFNFERLIKSSNNDHVWDMLEAYFTADIEMVKDFDGTIDIDAPAILCVEKNEIKRIRRFISYYREMGVGCFLITDNGSEDGTKEYLMQQPDVRLYHATNMYNARRKSAWQNRMISEYGLDKWYLYVDADEFIWYSGAEHTSLKDYCSSIRKRGIQSVKGIMVEMYPKGEIAAPQITEDDFISEYRYYDSAGYYYDPDTNDVGGGCLSRVFDTKSFTRAKTPLFFACRDRFIIGSHHIFPLEDDLSSRYGLFIKHYKFLPGDAEKINEAVINKNYANGSFLYSKYKAIYDNRQGISFYNNHSREWDVSAAENFLTLRRLDTE